MSRSGGILILRFQVAGQAYALECRRVVEVLPRVHLRELPHAPAHVAGLLRYRGLVVPVIDLGILLGHAPVADRLSTRIILVDGASQGMPRLLVGLLAEHVNDVDRIAEPGQGSLAPFSPAPYLGPVIESEDGLIQLLLVERIAIPQLAVAQQQEQP